MEVVLTICCSFGDQKIIVLKLYVSSQCMPLICIPSQKATGFGLRFPPRLVPFGSSTKQPRVCSFNFMSPLLKEEETPCLLLLCSSRSRVSCPLKLASVAAVEGYLRGELLAELSPYHTTSVLGLFTPSMKEGKCCALRGKVQQEEGLSSPLLSHSQRQREDFCCLKLDQ